jgi:hypothetical protein
VKSIEEALRAADAIFERHLAKLEILCMYCTISKRDDRLDWVQRARFDGVVREYRARRLELPVRAIWDENFCHGSALVHCNVRRLAWFVPAFLAAAVHGEDFAGTLRKLAELVVEALGQERARRGDAARDFSAPERGALSEFLRAAVAARAASNALTADDVRAVVFLAIGSGCDPWPIVGDLLESGHASEADDALAAAEVSIRRARVRVGV